MSFVALELNHLSSTGLCLFFEHVSSSSILHKYLDFIHLVETWDKFEVRTYVCVVGFFFYFFHILLLFAQVLYILSTLLVIIYPVDSECRSKTIISSKKLPQ